MNKETAAHASVSMDVWILIHLKSYYNYYYYLL